MHLTDCVDEMIERYLWKEKYDGLISKNRECVCYRGSALGFEEFGKIPKEVRGKYKKIILGDLMNCKEGFADCSPMSYSKKEGYSIDNFRYYLETGNFSTIGSFIRFIERIQDKREKIKEIGEITVKEIIESDIYIAGLANLDKECWCEIGALMQYCNEKCSNDCIVVEQGYDDPDGLYSDNLDEAYDILDKGHKDFVRKD